MFRREVTISDYYNNIFEKIKERIFSEKDEFIIGATTEKLTEYYFPSNHLQKIEIDNKRTEKIEYKKYMKIISSQEREEHFRGFGDIKYEYKSLLLTIPIIQNNDLNIINKLETLPMIFDGPPLNIQLYDDFILFQMDIKGYGFEFTEDEIVSKIKYEKEKITKWIKKRMIISIQKVKN